MRNTFLAMAVMVAGCGSPTNNPMDMTTKDTGGSPMDLTAADAILKTGCNGYIQCLIDCGSDMTCSAQCDKNVTSAGMTKFNQAIACGQNWCLGTNDMGTGDCGLNAAMTMLVDKPGAAAGTCNNCLNNSLAGLFGDTCSPTTSPNCNPAMCAGTVTACTASTP